VGTGPFKLVEAQSQGQFFDRDDNWWASKTGFQPASKVTRIGSIPTGDANASTARFINNEVDADAMRRLNKALDESIVAALEMGGTITGEHGVGQYKLRWLGLEQPEPLRELQRRIKNLFDPAGILNPGKAI
jgi:FAD/FMN-containing dehydrogenase